MEVLKMLATRSARDGDAFVSAADVSRIEWERTPPFERAFLPSNQSFGQSLAALHRSDLVDREWNDYQAVWEYRPSQEGWRVVRLAGWQP
jgi:hypothetical protein